MICIKSIATKTSGLFSVTAKAEFKNATSHNRFRGTGKILFVCGNAISTNTISSMLTLDNLNNFSIAQFEVKRNKRYLSICKVTVMPFYYTSESGTPETDNLTYTVNKVSDNVYEMHIEGLPGEYCIIYSVAGNANPYLGVFDFTIEQMIPGESQNQYNLYQNGYNYVRSVNDSRPQKTIE